MPGDNTTGVNFQGRCDQDDPGKPGIRQHDELRRRQGHGRPRVHERSSAVRPGQSATSGLSRSNDHGLHRSSHSVSVAVRRCWIFCATWRSATAGKRGSTRLRSGCMELPETAERGVQGTPRPAIPGSQGQGHRPGPRETPARLPVGDRAHMAGKGVPHCRKWSRCRCLGPRRERYDLTKDSGRAKRWTDLKNLQPPKCGTFLHEPCFDKIVGFIPPMPICGTIPCTGSGCMKGWTSGEPVTLWRQLSRRRRQPGLHHFNGRDRSPRDRTY